MQKAVTQHRKSMKYDSLRVLSAVKLNDINYLSWSEAVKAYLKAQDIWDVVERYNSKSELNKNDEKSVTVYRAWRKKDRKVWYNIQLFCNSVNTAFYKLKTVKKLWDCLKTMKKSVETTYYFAQIRAFMNYKQSSKETAEQMLFTLKTIQTEVAVLNLKTSIYDNMLQEIFLEALRDELYESMIFWI